ncbi:MAG: ABC transporter substrate-binding protein [Thermomicrobiales bacterium]|nr:ABC transporter substrate-binding protein [Thermomicrobiales bacterium]
MTPSRSRRAFLAGMARGGAAVATIAAASRGTTFAAPAVVQTLGSRVKVTYWGSFRDDLGAAEQALVRMFNESQQDVEVDYQYQGSYEETARKLAAALSRHEAPEVCLLADVSWFPFSLDGALAPLDGFMAAHKIDTLDYVDVLYQEGVRNGASYWLPFARSTPLFYYDRDAFAEAGLEAAPESWDQLVAIAPALARKGGDAPPRSAFAHPRRAADLSWLFQAVIWQFGGAYSDPDFTIRINEPKGVAAGDFSRASVADGWATTTDDPEADFAHGLTASIMASTSSLPGLIARIGDRFPLGTSFLPKKAKFGCCTGGAGLSLLASSPPERQEAGYRFIDYATSPEGTAFWSRNTGFLPVRKSAIGSPEMEAFFAEHPHFRTAVEQLPLAQRQDVARVFIPGGAQIIGEGLQRITIDQDEVQPVFDAVAAALGG